ncbi:MULTISPECIES: histidine phosphatase family protein [Dermacoccus]|uniref:histidine phosphatase family protein n=1 Tax=Dermacoccus TaxID=57495 RepID=UPI00093FD435|nr:histidine phosphatase family protein [Dermacoccus nishinomiyaensis]MBO1758542.1 histidine phosphatase family protein [Dermacoccus sp. NHGro5]
MTTLLLIRHGQTPNNVIGALDTALPGAGLTELGHAQASDLVPRLADHRIDRVVASAHDRARLTAEPLAAERGLTLTQDAGFGEIFAGDLEMATTHEAADIYLDTAYAWATGDLEARIPGGPAGAETLERFTEALERSLGGLDGDATLAVVSHGAMLRLWVTSQCENLTPQEVRRRRIPNTTVLTLEGRPGAWRFVAWDEPRLLDLAADDPTANADEK